MIGNSDNSANCVIKSKFRGRMFSRMSSNDSSMYSLPPILNSNVDVSLPTSMYKLPQLQGQVQINPQGDLQDLERRQDQLMNRLEDLDQKVSTMKSSLGLSSSNPRSEATNILNVSDSCHKITQVISDNRKRALLDQISNIKSTLEELKLAFEGHSSPSSSSLLTSKVSTRKVNLVVKASPSSPPYGLVFILKDILEHQKLPYSSSWHSHSSLTQNIPDSLKDFLPESTCEEGQSYALNVTMIWKEGCRDAESVIGLNLVKGEATLARFLSRIYCDVPSLSAYDKDAKTSAYQDLMMDESHFDLLCSDDRQKQGFLDILAKKLKNKPYLGCNGVDLVDYIVYSNVLNSRVVVTQAPVKNWMSGLQKRLPSPCPGVPMGNNNGKKTTKPNKNRCSASIPESQQKLFAFFESNGLSFTNVEHPEVFTVEEMMPYLQGSSGALTKNLFLKDKKKKLYLLSAMHDRKINLNDIAKKVGSKDLRFGDESVMFEKLGVKQGCVTAFALVNDTKKEIKFLVDDDLVNGSHQLVNFHPLVNTATTALSTEDFKRFLELTGHSYVSVKF